MAFGLPAGSWSQGQSNHSTPVVSPGARPAQPNPREGIPIENPAQAPAGRRRPDVAPTIRPRSRPPARCGGDLERAGRRPRSCPTLKARPGDPLPLLSRRRALDPRRAAQGELLERRGIRHLRTQPYRPRTIGKVERFRWPASGPTASPTTHIDTATEPCHAGSSTTTSAGHIAHSETDRRSAAFTTSVGRTCSSSYSTVTVFARFRG